MATEGEQEGEIWVKEEKRSEVKRDGRERKRKLW